VACYPPHTTVYCVQRRARTRRYTVRSGGAQVQAAGLFSFSRRSFNFAGKNSTGKLKNLNMNSQKGNFIEILDVYNGLNKIK
jgi:hypothetical protein